MKWTGVSNRGATIFTVDGESEKEARTKGHLLLKSDPTFRPLLKLWYRSGQKVKPKQ